MAILIVLFLTLVLGWRIVGRTDRSRSVALKATKPSPATLLYPVFTQAPPDWSALHCPTYRRRRNNPAAFADRQTRRAACSCVPLL